MPGFTRLVLKLIECRSDMLQFRFYGPGFDLNADLKEKFQPDDWHCFALFFKSFFRVTFRCQWPLPLVFLALSIFYDFLSCRRVSTLADIFAFPFPVSPGIGIGIDIGIGIPAAVRATRGVIKLFRRNP